MMAYFIFYRSIYTLPLGVLSSTVLIPSCTSHWSLVIHPALTLCWAPLKMEKHCTAKPESPHFWSLAHSSFIHTSQSALYHLPEVTTWSRTHTLGCGPWHWLTADAELILRFITLVSKRCCPGIRSLFPWMEWGDCLYHLLTSQIVCAALCSSVLAPTLKVTSTLAERCCSSLPSLAFFNGHQTKYPMLQRQRRNSLCFEADPLNPVEKKVCLHSTRAFLVLWFYYYCVITARSARALKSLNTCLLWCISQHAAGNPPSWWSSEVKGSLSC